MMRILFGTAIQELSQDEGHDQYAGNYPVVREEFGDKQLFNHCTRDRRNGKYHLVKYKVNNT